MMQDWLGKTVGRDNLTRYNLTRHDKWCCMMLPRLMLLRELLRDDGAISVSIDDNEVHHLRSLMDEVFGGENLIATVIWEKAYSPKSTAKFFSDNHDFIVVYARNKESFDLGLLPRTEQDDARYTNPDKGPRGAWKPNGSSSWTPIIESGGEKTRIKYQSSSGFLSEVKQGLVPETIWTYQESDTRRERRRHFWNSSGQCTGYHHDAKAG